MADAIVVVGPPWSGKSDWVRGEIRRREAAGELGIVMLGWSELFRALVPGAQSQFRDEVVSDSGSPRMVSAAFNFVAGAIAGRELKAYLISQSPERAVALADRLDAQILEVVASPVEVADRAEAHMKVLRRSVSRAALSASRPRCRRAAGAYFREQHRLTGRAHEVRRSGRSWKVDPEPKKPYDAAAFRRGLTPKGRAAITELQSLGNADPSPEAILNFLLRNPVEG